MKKKSREQRKTDPKIFLLFTWRNIKLRCASPCKKTINHKYYFGMEYCGKEIFIETFYNNQEFLNLWKQWQNKNFEYKYTPSVDRIDNNKGYLIDNIQFKTHSDNAGKDKIKLPILMFDLKGNFIREFESKWQAHQLLKIPNGNICKVCYGIRKSAGGYVFKFKS